MGQPSTATTRNPETGFSDSGLEKIVGLIEDIYNVGPNQANPRGRRLREWTVDDFGVLEGKTIAAIRACIVSERYDLVDRLKPTNMTRAEYTRAILREEARRNNGDLENFYSDRLAPPVSTITVTRPLDVPASQQVTVNVNPSIIAIRDAATNMLKNPGYTGIVFEPDVAAAMRRPDLALAGVPARTDAAVYDLGYTVGATPAFRTGQSLQLGVGFVEQPDTVQKGYCAVVADIFKPGRTIDQTEAFSAGFAQARIDAKGNFQGHDVKTGLFALCPSVTPPLTNTDRLALAVAR